MAINFCTISSTTVDGFCGNQRAKVLARLIATARPPVANVPIGGGHIEHRPQPVWQRPEIITPPRQLDFELPFITVTVKGLFGENGAQTYEVMPQVEFVTAFNLEFDDCGCPDENEEIVVLVTGLEI